MADLQKALTEDLSGVPFRIVLSLRPLIDFWTRLAERQDSAKGAVARVIAAEVAKVPELLEPLTDCSLTERHEELLDLLMAAAFPPALSQHGYGAAMVPMQLRGFYATPPMERLLMTEDWHLKGRLNLEGPMIAAMRRAYAYGMVLEKVYGLELELNVPLILTVPDPDTGLDRHFRLLFDWTFVDVEVQGEKPALPADMRHRVQISLLDAAEMADALPSDRFVLRGFTILKALEVTEQEVLSALKRDLIDRESIVSKERFTGLEGRLRTLFRRPQLQLGLGAIDGDRVLVLNDFSAHEHSCIFADSAHHTVAEFAGTIYARAVQKGEPIVIDDLATMPNRTPVEDAILASGVRTLVVAPLHYQDRVIGTLELGSPEPGDFDSSHLPALHEVLPLFAMAVRRSMEEFNARIQTAIKERFTAIHPVVEWRFRKAVMDGLERTGDSAAAELEPIVFENVYPLYALSDIRGSSVQRERAIQTDLLTQLALAREVVDVAYKARRLPALDQLRYRVERHAEQIREDVADGDEMGILAFLRAEVESLFEHLGPFSEAVRSAIEAYRGDVDPLPLRREALRRRRRLRHPLRDRQKAHRQGPDQGHDRAGDAAGQARHRIRPGWRGRGVSRLSRVPAPPRLRQRRGRGRRARRAAGRARPARAPRGRRPARRARRAGGRAGVSLRRALTGAAHRRRALRHRRCHPGFAPARDRPLRARPWPARQRHQPRRRGLRRHGRMVATGAWRAHAGRLVRAVRGRLSCARRRRRRQAAHAVHRGGGPRAAADAARGRPPAPARAARRRADQQLGARRNGSWPASATVALRRDDRIAGGWAAQA